jgi:cytochrome c-type biogenesis protein CcmF
MIPLFGFGVLALTFVVALYGVGAAIYGGRKHLDSWVESARKAQLLTFPLILLVAGTLEYLLLTGAYGVQFVYNVTSSSMPFYLRLTALWGGQSGSLVFWSLLMSTFTFAVTLRKWERDREFLPWVIAVCMLTLAFFVGLALFVENPFNQVWQTAGGAQIISVFQPANAFAVIPADGNGLNPLLRHPGMIIHPPMLYTGFVAFVIPFAFAIAALITGRTDDRWIRITRRWTLVAWLFLSMGLVLGMRWAYDVLGWGGYWGWDPVEIAALMPWLSGTAFLHSVMIQEKRGLFKRWNMILVLITYSLVIYGTFLTRSGVLSSVHAFAQSAVGPLFFGFIGLTFVISLALLLYRWNSLRPDGGNQMTSVLSREAFFLLNNLLFMGVLVVCFWGVNYPLISELFTGQKVTFGPVFYQQTTGPLFGGLLLLMGIAPLSAWGHSTVKTLGKALWKPGIVSLVLVGVAAALGVTSIVALIAFWLCGFVASITLYEYVRAVWARHRATGENLPLALWHLAGRNRRRYGGYIIHLGVILMALGVIGIDMFQTQTQGTVAQGQSITLDGFTFTYKDFAQWDTNDGRNVARAVLAVSKNGQPLGELYPRRDFFYESQQPMTIPGLRTSLQDDLYVVLVDWQDISSAGATFKVFHNPLVMWLWMGAFVFILGTSVAAWPDREPEPVRVAVKARVAVGPA